MIIDIHTHIYPQQVAAKILQAAKRKLNVTAPGKGVPADLLEMMKAGGVARSVLLPVARGREDVSRLNDWVLSVSNENARLTAFGAVHPLMPDLQAELDRLRAADVRGVKIVPLTQQVYPDDSRCAQLYEGLIERDMMLIAHAGSDPLSRPEVFGTPERFAAVAESYPDLRMILAHLGGLRMWDDVRRCLLPAAKNVYFDTAYVSFYMSREEMHELILDIGTQKVLFGSDYPWEDPGRAAQIISGLPLEAEERQAVLWKNAARLLGLPADEPKFYTSSD